MPIRPYVFVGEESAWVAGAALVSLRGDLTGVRKAVLLSCRPGVLLTEGASLGPPGAVPASGAVGFLGGTGFEGQGPVGKGFPTGFHFAGVGSTAHSCWVARPDCARLVVVMLAWVP